MKTPLIQAYFTIFYFCTCVIIAMCEMPAAVARIFGVDTRHNGRRRATNFPRPALAHCTKHEEAQAAENHASAGQLLGGGVRAELETTSLAKGIRTHTAQQFPTMNRRRIPYVRSHEGAMSAGGWKARHNFNQ